MAYYANVRKPPDLTDMPTRNVVLTDYQAEFVERLVSSGRYQNASEVLREGLRLVEDQEAHGRAARPLVPSGPTHSTAPRPTKVWR